MPEQGVVVQEFWSRSAWQRQQELCFELRNKAKNQKLISLAADALELLAFLGASGWVAHNWSPSTALLFTPLFFVILAFIIWTILQSLKLKALNSISPGKPCELEIIKKRISEGIMAFIFRGFITASQCIFFLALIFVLQKPILPLVAIGVAASLLINGAHLLGDWLLVKPTTIEFIEQLEIYNTNPHMRRPVA